MIPGVDPRQMKQMMRQMGITQTDIVSNEVVIKTNDKNIIIKNPSVQQVIMKGQKTFQISGVVVEEDISISLEISEDDIRLVSEQTNVSFEEAKAELTKQNGDIAKSIEALQ